MPSLPTSTAAAADAAASTAPKFELDHIFCFGPPLATAARHVLDETLGLVKTYERTHVGQGTANACYVFDNAYMELLWLTNAEEAQSPPIARTQLYQRSCFAENGASPFGIGWRFCSRQTDHAPVQTWPYCPPYLPSGMNIPVATLSDHLQLPFFFQSPGTRAPKDWVAASSSSLAFDNARQSKAGFTTLSIRRLGTTAAGTTSQAVELQGSTLDKIIPNLEYDASQHVLELELQHKDGHVVVLTLPSFEISYSSTSSASSASSAS